ncbi:MAPEG family protein [Catenovulum sp. SX2]|uniref:MAPEG family protein n=1 Tax=Catenovulum sp. SX2 TaxID=3398614 RepID=UPI003F842801
MLYPMFCMVILTFIIGVITLAVRVNSVRSGQVKIKYYRAMQGQEVPDIVNRTSRCFSNMFEIPVLFYVAASLFLSLNIHSQTAIVCAWLFVAFRCLQALVHLTYNNVLHRMLMFWGCVVTMLVMWVLLLLNAG